MGVEGCQTDRRGESVLRQTQVRFGHGTLRQRQAEARRARSRRIKPMSNT